MLKGQFQVLHVEVAKACRWLQPAVSHSSPGRTRGEGQRDVTLTSPSYKKHRRGAGKDPTACGWPREVRLAFVKVGHCDTETQQHPAATGHHHARAQQRASCILKGRRMMLLAGSRSVHSCATICIPESPGCSPNTQRIAAQDRETPGCPLSKLRRLPKHTRSFAKQPRRGLEHYHSLEAGVPQQTVPASSTLGPCMRKGNSPELFYVRTVFLRKSFLNV